MREITKTLSIPAGGKPMDFRLTKLDAFSGVMLLRMLSRIPETQGRHPENSGCHPEPPGRHPEQSEGSDPQSPALLLFTALSDADLRSLMTTCLEHTEVLLPAGWAPVMTRGEWCFPELEYDPAACLKLTVEEALWTLEGFFGAGAPASRTGTPAT